MDFNKIYKAPSLPKLSKRNISSSVLRGASVVSATPKLGKSRFSFLKPAAGVEGLKQNSVSDALTETNRILVEIQNQLATDFAFRIAEEKEQTKKIRATESKKRFLDKENAIEKIKGVGSGIKNQVDKILAPTKSIFQKIIDFFKIILTGIVLNAAFKWLEKPENQKKLGQFFGFLAEHWKWVLATLGTVILVDVIAKLVIAAQGIMAAFALLTSPAGLAALAFIGSYVRMKEVERIKSFVDETKQKIAEENKSPETPWYKKLGNFFAWQALSSPQGPSNPIGLPVPGAGFSRGGEVKPLLNAFSSIAQGFSTGGTVGGKGSGNVDTVPTMLAPGEFVTRTSATRLFKPFLSDINENAGRRFDEFKQAVIGLTNNVAIQKETSDAFNKILEDFNKFLDSEIQKRNMGAKGGGLGGGNINIRTGTPSKSGTDVMSPSSESNSNVSNISINNNISPGSSMMGNAGVIRPRSTPKQEKVYNTISTKPSPRTNIIPINLPPIKSKPPEISTPTRTATDVPVISSVNMANPYMQLTPEIYGIFV